MDPFAPVRSLGDEALARIVAKARALLLANRHGTPIRMRRQGEAARSTYWCPGCQPPAVPSGDCRATT